MSDYDALDDSTLQQMLSEASTYEQRSELRQVLRKRKKKNVGSVNTTKPRGNSVYNRFAGSTATKTSKNVASYGISVPASAVVKDDTSSSPTPTPTYNKASARPPASPTPPSPLREEECVSEDPSEETDKAPVAIEPTEDKEEEEEDEMVDQAEYQIPEAEDQIPEAEDQIPDHESEVEDPEIEDPEPEGRYVVGEEVDAGISLPPPSNVVVSEPVGSVKELQHYLVTYVNQELSLDPPLPVKGKALFDTCSDPVALCKLINKAVSGTVDMRALSKISGSASQRVEAMQDNMTLVVESARAIGCRIHDTMQDSIMEKEPETIKNFLVDLIRARVVHMPGMEDEPSSTFTDLDSLFQKLNISIDGQKDDVNNNSDLAKNSPNHSNKSSTELTYEERAARRKAEREQRLKQEVDGGSSVELTYEERAAQRKGDRERRRKEREALAK